VGAPPVVGERGAGAISLVAALAPVGEALGVVRLQMVFQGGFQHFFAAYGAGIDWYAFLVYFTAS
jgi:hypothetical protein